MNKSLVIAAVGLLTAAALYVGFWCMMTVGRQAQYARDARALADELATRYPALRFSGAGGYEGRIRITAVGEVDKATQTEIRDWIAIEKGRRGWNASIVLEFRDGHTGAELAVYDL